VIVIGKPIADPKIVQLDPKLLDAYTGQYRNSEDTLNVRREGARMLAQGSEDPEYELFPSSTDLFIVKAFDARIRFVRDQSGRVTSLVFEIMDQHNTLEKVKP
jgi:hypothetical protein